MPDLAKIQQMFDHLNRPLVRAKEMTKAFEPMPATWSALPAYYMRHLKSVLSNPDKLRLAMGDVTPMSILGLATAGPSMLGAIKAQPHKRLQAIAGALGNLLGGQVMQRTGFVGGLLGSFAGEGLGRALGAAVTPARHPSNVLADVASGRIDKLRGVNQKIDDILGGVQDKIGFEIDNAIRVPDIQTTEANIGGTAPALQTRPEEQYHNRNVASRGKTRPDDYPFLRMLSGLSEQVGGYEKDPLQQMMQGMNLMPAGWGQKVPSTSGLESDPRKPIPDRQISEIA